MVILILFDFRYNPFIGDGDSNTYGRVPADTLRSNYVVIVSKRRHVDVITSKWRRFDVITTSLLRHVFCVQGVVQEQPYGEAVDVRKEECVDHV